MQKDALLFFAASNWKGVFLLMKKTKIEWCDSTWNPVTGCLHGCEYCYARRMANRFGFHAHEPDINERILHEMPVSGGKKVPYPFDFAPTFHRYKLDEPARWTERKNIFVCSMSDLFGVGIPDDWTKEVLSACIRAPQHRYLLLTKQPQNTGKFRAELADKHFWVGTTVTCQDDVSRADTLMEVLNDSRLFLSIEPLLGPVELPKAILKRYGWVILGAETGGRKNRIVPKEEWIGSIVFRCKSFGIPVFMKNSLEPIVGKDGMLTEMPYDLRKP